MTHYNKRKQSAGPQARPLPVTPPNPTPQGAACQGPPAEGGRRPALVRFSREVPADIRQRFMRAAGRRNMSIADWILATCQAVTATPCETCGGPLDRGRCRACAAETEAARLKDELAAMEGRIARMEVAEPEAQAEAGPTDRKDVLLRAAYDLLVGRDEYGNEIDVGGVRVFYDGTICEPEELKNDLAECLGLPDGTEPLKGVAA